jgi:hypothetical protein
LFTLLNDIFEFYCEDAFAITCSSVRVPTVLIPSIKFVPLDLVFVKSVALPETFMRAAWFIISFLTVAPTVKTVAMTIFLAIIALFSLALHFLSFRINKLACFAPSSDLFVYMKDISAINVICKTENDPSVDAHNTIKSCISDATAANAKSLTPVNEQQCKLSYADAVGYEHMEIRRPRNPNVVGYADVYLGDLFPDIEDTCSTQVDNSTAPACKYSFLSVKAKKAQNLLEEFALNDSFGSMANLFTIEEINEVGFCDPAIELDNLAPIIAAISHEMPRRLSYADAVGYSHMEEVKRPRNGNVIGFDVDLSLLVPEEVDKNDINVPVIRRMSYSEAFSFNYKPIQANSQHNDDTSFFEYTQKQPDILISSVVKPRRRLSYAEAVNSGVNDDTDIPHNLIEAMNQEPKPKPTNNTTSITQVIIKTRPEAQ